MVYDGRAVANFVLDLCAAANRPVSNLALQKIVYFCHVWSLIELRTPLIRHKFEAWQYGPVLQYLYREFKAFDNSPITSRAEKIDPKTGEICIVSYEFDDRTLLLLRKVVNFYSRLSSGDLVKLTHAEGGPWYNVWNHSGTVNPGMKIDDEQIARYYSKAPRPFSIQ